MVAGILLQSGSLGNILGTAGNSLSILQYAPPVLGVVIVAFFVWLVWSKKKSGQPLLGGGGGGGISAPGTNLALIYSINHKMVTDWRPFKLVRKMDNINNVEETKAVFPNPSQQQQRGIGGIKNYIMSLFGRGQPIQPILPDEEQGSVFSEALAAYNSSSKGWLAIFSLETMTQLPVVTDNEDMTKKINEIERGVEKRVSRLKSAQLAITNYVASSTPIQQLGQIQLVSFVLMFIGAIAIAYALQQVGQNISNIVPLLQAAHSGGIATTGGVVSGT